MKSMSALMTLFALISFASAPAHAADARLVGPPPNPALITRPATDDPPDAAAATPTTQLPPDHEAIVTNPVRFMPEAWSEGVHLLAGLGVNGAVYGSRTAHRDLGLGSNFKTDVGWYVSDRLALEVGSNIKFNRSDDYLFWDTLFTVGVRYRFHSFLFNTAGTFVRVFVGDSPAVIYLGDANNPLKAIGATRAQIDGPVVGFGGGSFYQTSGGTNWFIEWNLSYQWLKYQDAIADKNDVPVVLQSGDAANNPTILAGSLSIGIVLF